MHRRVDLAFDPDVTLSDLGRYGANLVVLYQALRAALSALTGLQATPYQTFVDRVELRLQWLGSDLVSLHLDVPLVLDAQPKFRSAGAVLGCLYVLEGSALGGQLISAMAKRRLGVSPENGGRYFHGLGRQTSEGWRQFVEKLNATPAQSQDADDAVAAALMTFAIFERALEGAE